MTITVESLIADFDAEADRLRALAGGIEEAEGVRVELGRLVELDQLCRKYGRGGEGLPEAEWKRYRDEIGRRWHQIGQATLASLKGIIDRHGWPVISRFGPEAADAAWLLVQHADSEPELQKTILAVIEALLEHGEVEGAHYAYLYDRVASNEGRPQRFGTQGSCVGPGKWEPDPLELPERVDQLRAAVGLPSMAEYKKGFAGICK